MSAITVRDVPEHVYKALAKLAGRNRRSLQQQVLTLLEQASLLDQDSPLDTAAAIRARLGRKDLGDTVAEIRRERSR